MNSTQVFKFRLFIATGTHNSAQAVGNLDALCRTLLPGQHEIELVDVLNAPKRALEERIFMTPTLLKLEPRPAARVVGTLSDTGALMTFLGLKSVPK